MLSRGWGISTPDITLCVTEFVSDSVPYLTSYVKSARTTEHYNIMMYSVVFTIHTIPFNKTFNKQMCKW